MRTALARPTILFAGALAVSTATGAGIVVSPRVVGVGAGVAFILAGVAVTAPVLPTLRGLWLPMRWWQLLWLLLLVSGFVLRMRTTETAAETPVDLAGTYRIGLVSFVGVALLGLAAMRTIDVVGSIGRGLFLPLLFFNAVNILSTTWSVYPAWTLYRSLEFTVDTALAAVLAMHLRTTVEWRRMFNWMWTLTGLMLVSVAAGVVLAPGRAVTHGLGTLGFSIQGIFPAIPRNGVGHLSAVLIAVAVARIATRSRHRIFYLFLVAFAGMFLFASQTRSALVALAVAIPITLLAARRIAWTAAAPLVVAALFIGSGADDAVHAYVVRGQTEEQLTTLTGRTEYWSYAWDALQEQPLTGYGAFAGGRFVVASHFSPYTANIHGAFPELLVNTSIWGAIPIALVVVLTWWVLLRSGVLRPGATGTAEWALAVEALAVLTIVTTRTAFSAQLIWHPALEFLLLVAYAESLRRRVRSTG